MVFLCCWCLQPHPLCLLRRSPVTVAPATHGFLHLSTLERFLLAGARQMGSIRTECPRSDPQPIMDGSWWLNTKLLAPPSGQFLGVLLTVSQRVPSRIECQIDLERILLLFLSRCQLLLQAGVPGGRLWGGCRTARSAGCLGRLPPESTPGQREPRSWDAGQAQPG